MAAIVKEIQVGGYVTCESLEEACNAYVGMLRKPGFAPRTKIHFTIELPNGKTKTITIRDEDTQTVAYGDFEGLPDFLEYAKEVMGELNGNSSARTN